MIEEPKITVCVPVYNGEKNIRTAINSILAQTYSNIEIIICDNASTDNTAQIVESIHDKRINYIYYSDYLDVNYNFIRCLKNAKNEFICLFHADDFYYPEIIEEELKYLLDKNVGAVFSHMQEVDDNTIQNIISNQSEKIEIYNYNKYINEAMKKGTIFSCPTFMTRRSVLEKTGILNIYQNAISDMFFWMEIVRYYDVIMLDKVLMNYHRSIEQLSMKIFSKRKYFISPQFFILEKEIDNIGIESINKESIEVYRKRKRNEILEVIRNVGINDIKYSIKLFLAFVGIKKMSLENIYNSEKNYLDILYGRKDKL